MRKLRTGKLKDIVLIFFFAFSAFVILTYSLMVYDELTGQRFQYLESDDFVWIGFIIVGFIAIDILISRRFVRRAKKRNR